MRSTILNIKGPQMVIIIQVAVFGFRIVKQYDQYEPKINNFLQISYIRKFSLNVILIGYQFCPPDQQNHTVIVAESCCQTNKIVCVNVCTMACLEGIIALGLILASWHQGIGLLHYPIIHIQGAVDRFDHAISVEVRYRRNQHQKKLISCFNM